MIVFLNLGITRDAVNTFYALPKRRNFYCFDLRQPVERRQASLEGVKISLGH